MKNLQITKHGVWFPYKGDEVLYRWPWLKGPRYVSLLCEGEFNRLKEMDMFWQAYIEADSKYKEYLRASDLRFYKTSDTSKVEMCDICGQYPADIPSKHCAGCNAYMEHEF